MAILVAYDGSEPAQKAVEHAVENYPDQTIILLRVIEVSGGSIGAGVDLVQEKLKELREETTTELSETFSEFIKRNDIEFQMETVFGQPTREIVSYAEEHEIDVIVVGNHGREGISRVLLGSVAEKVVRRAPTTVTVVR